MAGKKTEIKCPWCGETIPTATVKTASIPNTSGTVIERRCTKCDNVLAAYLAEEGEFFSKMRTF